MMGRILLLGLSGFILLCALPSIIFAQSFSNDQDVAAPRFLSSLPDIPLMNGLIEAEGSAVSFDKPEGRIIEAYAILETHIHDDDVMTYYAGTLPQFGWGQTGEGQFYRSGEFLTLSFSSEEKQNIVKFSVTPTR